MPLDTRIPLGVTSVDPNGFTNALAAGMKMRELQNAGDRAAYKDELAVRKSNALSKFYQSPRRSEDIATLAQEAPDAVGAAEKSSREAQAHEATTKKAQLEWGMANYKLLREASASVVANPTRENATAVLDELEAQHGDMTRVRSQMQQTPDHAIGTLFKGLGSTVPQLESMALAREKAAAPKLNTYTNEWEYPPQGGAPASVGAQPTTAPAESAPTVAPAGPGTVVPGGELPPPGDIDAAVLHRAGQGPAPAGNVDYEGLSDEGLAELQRTSTASRKPPSSAVPPASPVDGQPAPTEAPQTPVVYRTQAERDAARDQRQDLRDAATDRRYADERAETTRRMDLQDRKFDQQTRKTQIAEEIATGQRLTAADASKAQQKLVRIDVMKRQMAAVRAAWEGTKQAKGIKGTMAAGPGAAYYAPGLLSEAGEKYDAAVAGLVASKTAMLRTPGVGTMTDFDQKLDIADLPTRNTHEATTEQQLVAYENMIADMESGYRGLLAGPAEAPAEAGPATPVQVSPDSGPSLPKPVKEFNSLPMARELPGKRMRFPDGLIYRSNGTDWVRQ